MRNIREIKAKAILEGGLLTRKMGSLGVKIEQSTITAKDVLVQIAQNIADLNNIANEISILVPYFRDDSKAVANLVSSAVSANVIECGYEAVRVGIDSAGLARHARSLIDNFHQLADNTRKLSYELSPEIKIGKEVAVFSMHAAEEVVEDAAMAGRWLFSFIDAISLRVCYTSRTKAPEEKIKYKKPESTKDLLEDILPQIKSIAEGMFDSAVHMQDLASKLKILVQKLVGAIESFFSGSEITGIVDAIGFLLDLKPTIKEAQELSKDYDSVETHFARLREDTKELEEKFKPTTLAKEAEEGVVHDAHKAEKDAAGFMHKLEGEAGLCKEGGDVALLGEV